MEDKDFKTIKNDEEIEKLIDDFDFRHSFIQNIHLVTGKSYYIKDNEAHTVLYIENKDGQVIDLWFKNVIIMHYPSMIHNNEEIITPTIKFENGYFYFKNNTNLVNESNYRNFNNMFIKCKNLLYKFVKS